MTLIAACGSSHRLNSRATTIRSFASSAKCAQGPFEVTVPAKGHRWGEALELRVSTPRRVKLIASVEPEGGFATKTERLLGGRGTRPDNQRCVVSVDEVGKSATSSGGGSPGAPGAPDGAGGGGGTTTTVTAKPPTLVSVPAVGRGQTLVRVSWRNPSLEPPRLRAGAKIRIRIWSIVPNDLAGVVFSLRRILYVPNKGDAAFVAHLKRLREKRQRRREERVRRREARVRRTRTVTVSAAEWRRRRVAADKRYAQRLRRQREAQRRKRLREEYCSTHLQDRECWGPGGFQVHVAMNKRRAERNRYCRSHANDARCWSRTELYRRRARWRRQVVRVTRKPKGPPPSPRAETKPPSPSDNAEWRPGYWHWAVGWKWIAGRWRVPQTDIDRGLTRKAPRRPPPPRVETRPPVVSGAVWIAGYWQWTGRGFVWVPGSWQLPPRVRLRWTPPRWELRSGGVVFVPGRWVPAP